MSEKQDRLKARQSGEASVEAGKRSGSDQSPVAVEFINSLQELTLHTLQEWLQANDAPDEILTLTANLVLLGDYANGGPGPDNMPALIVETVNAAAKMGARFYGPTSVTPARRRWK